MKNLIDKIVISPKYGKGIIKEVNGGSATIEFENETKKLLIKFAKLTFENGKKIEVKEEVEEEVKEINKRGSKRTVRKEVVITIDDLKEYRGLIMWYINNSNYGFNLTKKAMEMMLDEVNAGKVKSKTKRGIKGKLTKLAKSITLELAELELRNRLGLDITVNYGENTELEKFQQYRLDKLS